MPLACLERSLYSSAPLQQIHVHCTELCRFLALASSLPLVSVLWLVSASSLRRLSSLLYVSSLLCLSSLLCVVSAFCSASRLGVSCSAFASASAFVATLRSLVVWDFNTCNGARTNSAINNSQNSAYVRAPEGVVQCLGSPRHRTEVPIYQSTAPVTCATGHLSNHISFCQNFKTMILKTCQRRLKHYLLSGKFIRWPIMIDLFI